MRAKFFWDKVAADWVPANQYRVRLLDPRLGAPMVVADIQPYKSMQTGEMISGRRQHRDHLRAHGLVELGNDMPSRSKVTSTPQERVDSIRQAMHELRNGRPVPKIGRYGEM